MNWTGIEIATVFGRIVLGVLFFFQGYDKIFQVKLRNAAEAVVAELSSSHIPRRLIVWGVYLNAVAEFAGGALLVTGVLQLPVLIVLGLNMIFVAVAMSLVSPFWSMEDYFPRLALLLFLLYTS
jgi:uncharacterized membrane protein YphA (DoxX/SURF4 family)